MRKILGCEIYEYIGCFTNKCLDNMNIIFLIYISIFI